MIPWSKFFYTLATEKEGGKITVGKTMRLSMTCRPLGDRDKKYDYLYERPQKLVVIVNSIEEVELKNTSPSNLPDSVWLTKIKISCTVPKDSPTVPAGIKPGTYSLNFVKVDGDFVCGDNRKDIAQMVMEGTIPADEWEIIMQEAGHDTRLAFGRLMKK